MHRPVVVVVFSEWPPRSSLLLQAQKHGEKSLVFFVLRRFPPLDTVLFEDLSIYRIALRSCAC